jgi:hypothetical protein
MDRGHLPWHKLFFNFARMTTLWHHTVTDLPPAFRVRVRARVRARVRGRVRVRVRIAVKVRVRVRVRVSTFVVIVANDCPNELYSLLPGYARSRSLKNLHCVTDLKPLRWLWYPQSWCWLRSLRTRRPFHLLQQKIKRVPLKNLKKQHDRSTQKNVQRPRQSSFKGLGLRAQVERSRKMFWSLDETQAPSSKLLVPRPDFIALPTSFHLGP